MQKYGSPYPQLKGPHQKVGVRIPNSRGYARAWESASPTSWAMQKHGSLNPQLKGRAKLWEAISPTQGTTLQRGSPYPKLKKPRQSVGVRIPKPMDPTKAWDSVCPT